MAIAMTREDRCGYRRPIHESPIFLTVVGEVAAPQQFLINFPASACRSGKIDGSSGAIFDVCENVGNNLEEPLSYEAVNDPGAAATPKRARLAFLP
jgi:hypothetical protein